MKLHPMTWTLVSVAALLGGFVYFSEVRGSSQPEQAETQTTSLFGFEEKQVQRFRVRSRLHNLLFERDAAGKWQMLEPDRTPASDASVAYLLNLLATQERDRAITASPEAAKDYGLDQPIATIFVTLDNGQAHKLVIGGYDFNRSNLYAQADPATSGDLQVVTVSPDFDSAVNRSIPEWKQSAPTPSPTTPTESPTPDEAIDSPAASPSPTNSPIASPSASASPSPTPSPAATPSPTGSPSPAASSATPSPTTPSPASSTSPPAATPSPTATP